MNEQIENIHSQMQIVKISLSGLTGKMETTEEVVSELEERSLEIT